MENTFCIIGRQDGDKKYIMVAHDPLLVAEAHLKASTLTGYRDIHVVRGSLVKKVIDALNGEGKIVGGSKDLVGQMEMEIEFILRRTINLMTTKPKTVDIFVGHEKYEVEVTMNFEEKNNGMA